MNKLSTLMSMLGHSYIDILKVSARLELRDLCRPSVVFDFLFWWWRWWWW